MALQCVLYITTLAYISAAVRHRSSYGGPYDVADCMLEYLATSSCLLSTVLARQVGLYPEVIVTSSA